MNILYFIVLAFAVVAGILDSFSSRNFIYYNGMEGNRSVADKYGYHSTKKEWMIWGVAYGLGIVAPFLPFFTQDSTSYGIGAVLYGIMGGYRLNEAKRNRKKMREGRVKQLIIVQNIKDALASGSEQNLQSIFDNMVVIGKGGRYAFGEFGWLYTTNSDINTYPMECRNLVINWVKAGAVFPK